MAVKDIIIVGAGHMAADVYELIHDINRVEKKWNIKGFLNDTPVDLMEALSIPEPLLGRIVDWQPSADESYAIAIGDPVGREKVVRLLKSRGAQFETLVSPRSVIRGCVKIGEGSLILSRTVLARCSEIRSYCVIGDTTVASHAVIEDFTNTASYANIYQNIQVGHHSRIWSHAVILNHVGNYATVGAGSVVISRVKDNTTVFGSPAKKVEL